MWVLNKTGVSLAYRAEKRLKEKAKKETTEEVKFRQPGGEGCFRTDADTMKFSRWV